MAAENSASDNLNSSMTIPPPTVLDRVLKDIFHEGIQIAFLSIFVHVMLTSSLGVDLH